MELKDVIGIDSLPKLDLHGYDRDCARVAILDFIKDQIKLKRNVVVIIHGVGSGILRKTTHEVLKHHKKVKKYQIFLFNAGCTIVELQVEV